MTRAAISIIVGLILAAAVLITAAHVVTGQKPDVPFAAPFDAGH